MNKRKQIALNKLFNTSVVLGVLSVCIFIELFSCDEIIWGVILAVVACLLILLPLIFTPCCYIFDSEGVSFCYILISNERFLWKDIYAIEVEDINPPYSHMHSIILDFLIFNKKIYQFADENDITFIDLHKHYVFDGKMNPELTKDGIHLRPEAYSYWYEELVEHLGPQTVLAE